MRDAIRSSPNIEGVLSKKNENLKHELDERCAEILTELDVDRKELSKHRERLFEKEEIEKQHKEAKEKEAIAKARKKKKMIRLHAF